VVVAMKLEPALSAYKSVRQKAHGVGEGSASACYQMALAMLCLSNGCRLGMPDCMVDGYPWDASIATGKSNALMSQGTETK